MSSVSSLEIVLCFLFGCVLLVLSVELCYLLYWKQRLSNNSEDIESQHFSSSNMFSAIFSSCTSCCKTSKSIKAQEKSLQTQDKQQDSDMGLAKDLVAKGLDDESLDLELMRLHNLCGPPRFLFTINEETKEDLESERSKRGSTRRSMSDILDTLDTPFMSPLASPAFRVPQHFNLEAYNNNGVNHLFKSGELGYNMMRSSPPPTFKFLRDAEEKLLKRLMQMEVDKKSSFKKMDQDSPSSTEEKDGSFVNIVVSKGNNEGGHHQVSTHSKVLLLASSPTAKITPIDKKW
ncbi:uncharacterized protein [Rutidosis leptorrhynchoides]|uniref:uncharacterized protein n=1 Tax=Rutidosis leptorrhynchoides TaxID=125765 RepID=UPI003A998BB8